MTSARTSSLVLAVVALAATATAGEPATALAIAAAANVKPALEQVVTAFQHAHPEATVRATYGGSGALYAQVQQGAPFDLFLAADTEYPAKLVAAGLSAGPAAVYAHGTLVLWVPRDSRLAIEAQGLAALQDPSVLKVALGNPAVAPYGQAAKEALGAAGLWDTLQPSIVLGQSVGQAAQFAQSGNAQAALLPRSLAMAPPLSTEGRFVEVPAGTYRPLLQAGVVLRASRAPKLARAFLDFLRGPEGRAIFSRSGYGLPRD